MSNKDVINGWRAVIEGESEASIKRHELIRELRKENPHEVYFDCLSCRQSLSSEDNRLFCVVKDTFVEENHLCREFN